MLQQMRCLTFQRAAARAPAQRRGVVLVAATAAPAATTAPQSGTVVKGTILSVTSTFARVDVRIPGITGLLPGSKVTQDKTIRQALDVFSEGEEITAVVAAVKDKTCLLLSTAVLESTPGQILTDKQAVFANAEAQAAVYNEQRLRRQATKRAWLAGLKVGDEVSGSVVRVDASGPLIRFGTSLQHSAHRGAVPRNVKAGAEVKLQVAQVDADTMTLKFESRGRA